MEVTAVIPARLNSSRLPRKVLADLNGHPLLWHVWQCVGRAKEVAHVYIATDSVEVKNVVENWGGQVVLTSSSCISGTERISEALGSITANSELILNVQGDEPFIDPALLDLLVTSWCANPTDIITPVYPLLSRKEYLDPNVVKVVLGRGNRQALYFSRAPLPFIPEGHLFEHAIEMNALFGHIGVYGYSRQALLAYPLLPSSVLEQLEQLEQLRFLTAGYHISIIETNYRSLGVNTAEDLRKARERVAHGSSYTLERAPRNGMGR